MIPKSFLAACTVTSFSSVFAQTSPTPFHLQGTVDPGDVAVESVEGETTRRSVSWHAKPVIARDPGGSFYVGNKRTVMKLSPAGVPQWKLTFSRIDSQSPEPGISSEHWQHEVLDQGAGLPLHNAWNINNRHASTLGDPDVVDDMDIVDIKVTEDYLLIVGRVIQGNGPSVYLARFSLEGQYFWRQVTSTGIAYLARPDYICTHVDEANDRILITESGENINGQFGTVFTPRSHIVDIALSDGTRGAGYTLGYNGSNPEQFKNHRILKSLLLEDGRLVWIARTAETFTESPNLEDVNYRLETYDPDTQQIGYSLPYLISENEPFQPGHIRRTLADIALDDEGRVIVLSNRIVQLDGIPVERYDYFVEGFLPDATDSNMNGQTLDLLWSYSPDGEEWGDRMVLEGDTITITGKAENYLRFPGWFLSRLDLNGALAPGLGWLNITPYDSFSYRVTDLYSVRVRDFVVDGSGNVYLTALYGESDRDFNVLVDSTLAYVKYSNAGELQFIRPLPGFDYIDQHVPNAFGYGSSSPAQLLVAPDAPAQSQAPSYSVFGLVTTPETAVDLMDASTKKWQLLYLEQENVVAASARTFETPQTVDGLGLGSTVNATTVRTDGTELQAVFSTAGTPYRIWFENLPEGMFFNQATDANGKYVAVLNGPISAPYGTYTFTAFASDAHGTISQEFTLEHLSPTPVDILRPGLALSGPKTTKAKKISINGVAGDDVQVASVKYRVKAGKKPFSGAKLVALSAGTQVRTFTLAVPTPKTGVYKIEFTVTDSSGKTTVKTFTCNRK